MTYITLRPQRRRSKGTRHGQARIKDDETPQPTQAGALAGRSGVDDQALRTTFSQPSSLLRNMSYPRAAWLSGNRWVMTKLGSISPF